MLRSRTAMTVLLARQSVLKQFAVSAENAAAAAVYLNWPCTGASIPPNTLEQVPPLLPLLSPLPPPLPFPLLPSSSLPSPPLRSRPPLLRLGGLGERFSSHSGSGRSPAAKRYLVNFRLKISPLVATIFRNLGGSALIINALPPKFLQKRVPYFFHGAFAPSFIWSRRPWVSYINVTATFWQI